MIFDCESLSFILSCELGHILHSSASNNVSCLPVPCCLHVPCSLRVSCCLNVPLLPECAPVPACPSISSCIRLGTVPSAGPHLQHQAGRLVAQQQVLPIHTLRLGEEWQVALSREMQTTGPVAPQASEVPPCTHRRLPCTLFVGLGMIPICNLLQLFGLKALWSIQNYQY